MEMLVVIALILLMLAALIPAVTSLSKSSGRQAGFNALMGAIEQARAAALESEQSTYMVFATFSSAAQSTLDQYNYRSYAIFEDDAANPGSVKQLTPWRSLPTGVALRSAGPYPLSNLAPTASPAPSPIPTFTFTPDTSATALCQYIKFNWNGQVQTPVPPSTDPNVRLGVFEGYVKQDGTEIATTKDASGNPSAVQYIVVSQFTGRAEPADAVSTPTPTPGP